MAAHTPGPWAAKEIQCEEIQCDALSVYHDPERVKADARLIAAAPDLLVAARAALGAIEAHDVLSGTPGKERPVKVVLRAAIAKAEGK